MTMASILITHATRPLGLRIAKYLEQQFVVEKCSSDEIPSVLQSAYSAVPVATHPTFAHEMLKLALDKNCTYVLPLGQDEIRVLAEAAVLFEEYGVHLLCPLPQFLSEVNVLVDPASNIHLQVLFEKKDIVTGEEFEHATWNGLCLVSDSKDEFILAVV